MPYKPNFSRENAPSVSITLIFWVKAFVYSVIKTVHRGQPSHLFSVFFALSAGRVALQMKLRPLRHDFVHFDITPLVCVESRSCNINLYQTYINLYQTLYPNTNHRSLKTKPQQLLDAVFSFLFICSFSLPATSIHSSHLNAAARV